MSKSEDGGPAFLVAPDDLVGSKGMTLRDWFAGRALAGINAGTADEAARLCYSIAEAMLSARSKEAPNPLQAELDAAKAQIANLESLRPHWAQGYSSDSIAAQTSTSALAELWALLGVPHQTAAVERLRNLLAMEAP